MSIDRALQKQIDAVAVRVNGKPGTFTHDSATKIAVILERGGHGLAHVAPIDSGDLSKGFTVKYGNDGQATSTVEGRETVGWMSRETPGSATLARDLGRNIPEPGDRLGGHAKATGGHEL